MSLARSQFGNGGYKKKVSKQCLFYHFDIRNTLRMSKFTSIQPPPLLFPKASLFNNASHTAHKKNYCTGLNHHGNKLILQIKNTPLIHFLVRYQFDNKQVLQKNKKQDIYTS